MVIRNTLYLSSAMQFSNSNLSPDSIINHFNCKADGSLGAHQNGVKDQHPHSPERVISSYFYACFINTSIQDLQLQI